MAVVAVAVAAVVVIAVLAGAGVLTPSKSAGQGVTGTALSYSQVASEGAQGVQSEYGNSSPTWSLVAVEGLGLTSSASGANAAGTLDNGCTVSPAAGAPSSVTLPATPTGSTPGTTAVWFFLAVGSSSQVLIYTVTQAAAYPLFILAGSCTSELDGLTALTGLSVVNSTQVANSANAAGGSAFLSSNSNVLQAFVLFGPGLSGSMVPYWAVEYNTCGLATSGTGTVFIGIYDAGDGSPVSSPTTESADC